MVASTGITGGTAPQELFSYQKTGAAFLLSSNKSILADEPGLGKTICSLHGARHDSINVVCPASVKSNWAVEITRNSDLTPVICQGHGTFRWALPGEIVIANPEIIPDWIEFPTNPLTLIIDEAHTYRNFRAQKFQNARACFARARYNPDTQVIALTGTPIVNRLTDLANIMEITGIMQDKFGSRENFASIGGGKVGRRRDINGACVTKEMTDIFATFMLRRTKADVMEHLPAKIYRVMLINEWSKSLNVLMDKGHESIQAYEALSGPIDPGSLPHFTELAKIRKEMAVEKTPYVEEFVKHLGECERSVVVFSAHRYPVETIAKKFDYDVVTGSVSPKKRQKMAEKFLAGESNGGIGLTIGAGNCGINLQSADQMAFCDLSWNLADNLQAEDRIHRIGQQAKAVTYTYFTMNHPLDRRMGQILTGKKHLFDAVCDPVTRKN